MAKKIIQTEILINASPEKVWSILTNFEEYPSWNPFVLSLTGEMVVGQKIKIVLPDMSFNPTLLVYNENKEMRWIGKLLFKGVFDGEHSFVIIDNENGTVTFKHEEIFSGMLVGPFSKKLDRDTKPGFQAMNEKLKDLAEMN